MKVDARSIPRCRSSAVEARPENLRKKKKNPAFLTEDGARKGPGSVLLSHTLTRAVPSALEGLTSEFEMGSGMAPPTLPPEELEVSARALPAKSNSTEDCWFSGLGGERSNPRSGPFTTLLLPTLVSSSMFALEVVKPHGRLVQVSSAH